VVQPSYLLNIFKYDSKKEVTLDKSFQIVSFDSNAILIKSRQRKEFIREFTK